MDGFWLDLLLKARQVHIEIKLPVYLAGHRQECLLLKTQKETK